MKPVMLLEASSLEENGLLTHRVWTSNFILQLCNVNRLNSFLKILYLCSITLPPIRDLPDFSPVSPSRLFIERDAWIQGSFFLIFIYFNNNNNKWHTSKKWQMKKKKINWEESNRLTANSEVNTSCLIFPFSLPALSFPFFSLGKRAQSKQYKKRCREDMYI